MPMPFEENQDTLDEIRTQAPTREGRRELWLLKILLKIRPISLSPSGFYNRSFVAETIIIFIRNIHEPATKIGTDTARAKPREHHDDLGLGLISRFNIHFLATADADVCRRGCIQRACLHSRCAGGKGKDGATDTS